MPLTPEEQKDLDDLNRRFGEGEPLALTERPVRKGAFAAGVKRAVAPARSAVAWFLEGVAMPPSMRPEAFTKQWLPPNPLTYEPQTALGTIGRELVPETPTGIGATLGLGLGGPLARIGVPAARALATTLGGAAGGATEGRSPLAAGLESLAGYGVARGLGAAAGRGFKFVGDVMGYVPQAIDKLRRIAQTVFGTPIKDQEQLFRILATDEGQKIAQQEFVGVLEGISNRMSGSLGHRDVTGLTELPWAQALELTGKRTVQGRTMSATPTPGIVSVDIEQGFDMLQILRKIARGSQSSAESDRARSLLRRLEPEFLTNLERQLPGSKSAYESGKATYAQRQAIREVFEEAGAFSEGPINLTTISKALSEPEFISKVQARLNAQALPGVQPTLFQALRDSLGLVAGTPIYQPSKMHAPAVSIWTGAGHAASGGAGLPMGLKPHAWMPGGWLPRYPGAKPAVPAGFFFPPLISGAESITQGGESQE